MPRVGGLSLACLALALVASGSCHTALGARLPRSPTGAASAAARAAGIAASGPASRGRRGLFSESAKDASYLELASQNGTAADGTASNGHGATATNGHAAAAGPLPEAPTVPQRPAPRAEPAPVPAAQPAGELAQQQEREKSLGQELGSAAAGVGGGIRDAAGSFAQGAVAVAGEAGDTVANALDSVAGIFRGRRLATLLAATVAALDSSAGPAQAASINSLGRALAETNVPAEEQPPSLGNCTLADLGVSPAAGAAMAPTQQAALQAACLALLRLSPAQEAELEAAIQAAAEPYYEELAQVALPLPLALIGGINETAAGQLAATLDGSVLPSLNALVNSTVAVLLDAGILADEQQAADFVGALRAVSAADGEAPAASAPSAPSDAVGRRLRQAGTAGPQGPPDAGETRFAGSVVGCRGSDCRGYRVQGTSAGGSTLAPIPAAEAAELAGQGLGSLLDASTATLATGAALEAGLLASSGALRAAGAALDAASAALAAELGAPVGGTGRRLAEAAPASEAQTAGAAPQPAGATAAEEVQQAIEKGTQAATQGLQVASNAAGAAVGGAAGVVASAADAARNITLQVVGGAAEVAAAVQRLVQTGQTIGQVISSSGRRLAAVPAAEAVAAPGPASEAAAPGGPAGVVGSALAQGRQGVQTASDAAGAALSGAAGIVAGAANTATNLTLGAVQGASQVAGAVQGIVDVGKSIG